MGSFNGFMNQYICFMIGNVLFSRLVAQGFARNICASALICIKYSIGISITKTSSHYGLTTSPLRAHYGLTTSPLRAHYGLTTGPLRAHYGKTLCFCIFWISPQVGRPFCFGSVKCLVKPLVNWSRSGATSPRKQIKNFPNADE